MTDCNPNIFPSDRTCLLAKPEQSSTYGSTFASASASSLTAFSTATSTSTSTSSSTRSSLVIPAGESYAPPSRNATGNGNPTNYSNNSLMSYRLQEMRASATTNLWLAIWCLVYLGINISLICVNYVNLRYRYDHEHKGRASQDSGEDKDKGDEPVDDIIYHLIEFWATFGFAIVECLALANTPKSLYAINGDKNPLFLRLVMFSNIVATAVPALLVSLSIETFEIVSHEIEYINELTMAFIDVILLISLWNSRTGTSDKSNNESSSVCSWATASIALVVACVQLAVYNLLGYDTETQDMVGEPLAHFLEFAFEIISSLIAFWFCMDNKYIADTEIGLILYGTNHDQECNICSDKAGEFALDRRGSMTMTMTMSAATANPNGRISSSAVNDITKKSTSTSTSIEPRRSSTPQPPTAACAAPRCCPAI